MQALVFGDLHGRIRAMYRHARDWEKSESRIVDTILQVGDFGIFPDPSRLTEVKIDKYGPGDYAELIREGWSAPIPTYFCKGNNEDFEALERPLPPNLHYVPDGTVVTLGESRIGFLGGGWGRKSYELEQPKPKHISRTAVESLLVQDFDILICHEAPAGTRFGDSYYAVGAPPLRDLIREKQPRLVIHGHHHAYAERLIGDTRTVALGLVDASDDPAEWMLPVNLE